MNNRKKIGLDEWELNCEKKDFYEIMSTHDLEIYDLHEGKGNLRFFSNLWQRRAIVHAFPNSIHVRTTGMLGYALRSMKRGTRIVSLLIVIVLWYVLTHLVFSIQINGQQQESKQWIQESLKDMGVKPPFFDSNVKEIKATLKKRLEDHIAWLEIEKQGSRYILSYTPKEFVKLEKLSNKELIAQEDGVIERFDIAHGNKVHKVNDFVHKGDVLVSNILLDSKQKEEDVFVSGRVYAFTWRDVEVTMNAQSIPKSFQYFELLLQARGEVSKDFLKGDKIYSENILQFSNELGKIKMVIHYTLIKDITTPH